MTVINAQDRFQNKERSFWKEFKRTCRNRPPTDDINDVLRMLWPETTQGKKDKLQPFNPDF